MNSEVLGQAQAEMQERSAEARKKEARRKAGLRKKKKSRSRASIETQLIELAQDKKVPWKGRAWAIQQRLLLRGKPVQSLEDDYEEPKPEPKPEPEPTFTGADLGKPEINGLPLVSA